MGPQTLYDPSRTQAGVRAPAVVLDRVTKYYGSVVGVSCVGLTVAPGELVTVIGPSGCGKSTLLRLIAGLERPDVGTIRLTGTVVAGRHRFQPPERRRTGLVFQDHALFPHLDVAGNVGFGVDGLSRPDRRARIGQLLELVRLAHLAGRYPHELSGGEQQRVALARALAPRPAVVLLDEPFSDLDESLRAQVRRDTVAALRETAATAILVTHHRTEALAVGHRVAVMHGGTIEQAGTPQAVFEQPATRFVASFLSEPVFLPTHAHRGRLACEIGVLPAVPDRIGRGRDVVVALRPHEVAIHPDADAPARVAAVEYHGAFVLHHLRLASGTTVSSWQPHHLRHPVGTPMAVTIAAGATPPLFCGDTAITGSPPTLPGP